MSIKEKERKWIQDRFATEYSFTNLLELRRQAFYKLVENDNWAEAKECPKINDPRGGAHPLI